jgi:TolB-like protein
MAQRTLTIIFLFLLSACSNLNCTRLETLLGGDVNLVSLGGSIGETLARESFPPILPAQTEQPIYITTIVDNNNFYETTDFGRALQNHIASSFVKQGYTVKEVKLRSNVLIRKQDGEFMLSRDLEELSNKQRAQAMVVGTYSMANRVMYLSIRLVDPRDQKVRSTYDKRLCLDENTLRMLGLQFEESESIQPPREPLLDRILY